MKRGSMVCCISWRGLPGHTSPLVETARTGVAKVAGMDAPEARRLRELEAENAKDPSTC
jgi:hypothetical protein